MNYLAQTLANVRGIPSQLLETLSIKATYTAARTRAQVATVLNDAELAFSPAKKPNIRIRIRERVAVERSEGPHARELPDEPIQLLTLPPCRSHLVHAA